MRQPENDISRFRLPYGCNPMHKKLPIGLQSGLRFSGCLMIGNPMHKRQPETQNRVATVCRQKLSSFQAADPFQAADWFAKQIAVFRLPLPIFCPRRRFAAYHEQGQAPAPRPISTLSCIVSGCLIAYAPKAACVAKRSCEAKTKKRTTPKAVLFHLSEITLLVCAQAVFL